MLRKERNGFSLLELLIVVGIIALLAAIAMVNYFAALDRARLKKTMNDMRVVAIAWEARAIDSSTYDVTGFTFPPEEVAYSDLHAALVPTYIRLLPEKDGWNRPLQFAISDNPKDYSIRAAGKDGKYQEGEYTEGQTSHPDCDIVFSNGSFIVYPGVLVSSN